MKSEPENLLLLTRTKIYSSGRRHSVRVPLIPPPDGEKFEGGYHIERNPISGGSRLIGPVKGGMYDYYTGLAYIINRFNVTFQWKRLYKL